MPPVLEGVVVGAGVCVGVPVPPVFCGVVVTPELGVTVGDVPPVEEEVGLTVVDVVVVTELVVDVVPDAADGRVMTLRSTERAESRMLEVRHENRAVFRNHVEGWSDGELAEFAGWLRRFNTPAG